MNHTSGVNVREIFHFWARIFNTDRWTWKRSKYMRRLRQMCFNLNNSFFLSKESHIQFRPFSLLDTNWKWIVLWNSWIWASGTLIWTISGCQTTKIVTVIKIIKTIVNQINLRSHVWDISTEIIWRQTQNGERWEERTHWNWGRRSYQIIRMDITKNTIISELKKRLMNFSRLTRKLILSILPKMKESLHLVNWMIKC